MGEFTNYLTIVSFLLLLALIGAAVYLLRTRRKMSIDEFDQKLKQLLLNEKFNAAFDLIQKRNPDLDILHIGGYVIDSYIAVTGDSFQTPPEGIVKLFKEKQIVPPNLPVAIIITNKVMFTIRNQ